MSIKVGDLVRARGIGQDFRGIAVVVSKRRIPGVKGPVSDAKMLSGRMGSFKDKWLRRLTLSEGVLYRLRTRR